MNTTIVLGSTNFTLRMNKIFIRPPKIMRKVTMALDLDLPTITLVTYEKWISWGKSNHLRPTYLDMVNTNNNLTTTGSHHTHLVGSNFLGFSFPQLEYLTFIECDITHGAWYMRYIILHVFISTVIRGTQSSSVVVGSFSHYSLGWECPIDLHSILTLHTKLFIQSSSTPNLPSNLFWVNKWFLPLV